MMRAVLGEHTGGIVLLVEDDELVRAVVKRALSDAGYHVVEAADGPSALAAASFAHTRVDVLIADVVLPGMSGPEVADELVRSFGRVRVLYVSGYGEKAFPPTTTLPPATDWLPKPFSPTQLVEKVRGLMATA